MIVIEIPGKPQAKQRPRLGRWGAYTPAPTQAFERKVAAAAKKAGVLPVGGKVVVNTAYIMPIPKSWPKYKKLALDRKEHLQKPDKDNLDKCVLDGLNGHAYFDDSQVFMGTPAKFWSSDCGEGMTIIKIDQSPDEITLDDFLDKFIYN